MKNKVTENNWKRKKYKKSNSLFTTYNFFFYSLWPCFKVH